MGIKAYFKEENLHVAVGLYTTDLCIYVPVFDSSTLNVIWLPLPEAINIIKFTVFGLVHKIV